MHTQTHSHTYFALVPCSYYLIVFLAVYSVRALDCLFYNLTERFCHLASLFVTRVVALSTSSLIWFTYLTKRCWSTTTTIIITPPTFFFSTLFSFLSHSHSSALFVGLIFFLSVSSYHPSDVLFLCSHLCLCLCLWFVYVYVGVGVCVYNLVTKKSNECGIKRKH